ncbi:protein translocase subunit SecF [Saccharopolyspora aridisoli]|uniref:Protein-export membrane protein SecF n=1 Tax=Saccharopolyspora aridisoli TaxID=2530385 RepID=A0A4R4UAX5_9PSEU|nr:protein translocase subunit SecF [Saccharopolyspora aridisoli]TDC88677.1 protein translocase subunit SecF [Saccharopolyspora aridisoli]
MKVTTPETEGAQKRESVFHRLYTGTGAFDIIGKRSRWYIALGLLVLLCIGAIGFKGFNLGIDFEGGTKISVPAVGAQGPIETDAVQSAFSEAIGHPAETVQVVGAGANQSIQVRSSSLTVDQVMEAKQEIFNQVQPLDGTGKPSQQVLSDSAVSGTWGGEITTQALLALGVFLVLVTIFLAFYFEKWMAVAALAALLHDVVVTAGIYSLVGFEVTPSTVIGLLTILGFSLYDTVVVFDKVKENTRGLLSMTRRTYPEAANLAVNQTLMRSINTSVIALLPVLGLLVVGAGLLGVGVLRDLALVQLVGMITGVVSSIYLATPLLVDLKMSESKYRSHAKKVEQRRAKAAAREAGEDVPEEPKRPVPAGATTRQQPAARPAGKAARPSGKRRR